jgi:hypothetical protein
MGKITATNGTISRTFTCAQYALMNSALPSGWTITDNTCGVYLAQLRSPYASFGLEIDGTRLPGNWYTYKGTISSNRVIVPTSVFTLPGKPDNVAVIVRRQMYNPDVPGDTRDFAVNNTDNSIDFNPALSLNGQVAYIRVFK